MPAFADHSGRFGGLALALGYLALGLAVLWSTRARAEGEATFEERSLRYRTALHHDPLLDSALGELVDLYREAERVDELVGLYRSHIEQYPDDAGAKAALIRILREVDRGGADGLIVSAAQRHPEFAPLQYLRFRLLEEKGDDRTGKVLVGAIERANDPARRRAWLEELLKRSDDEKARSAARDQLEAMLEGEDRSAESLLSLGRLMQRHAFWALSLAALKDAKAAGLSAADQVDADVLLARARAELGDRDQAGRLLDALLDRLAPDHWRRREIMSLRYGVLATDEARAGVEKRLRGAYEANPEDESAALDYAAFLVAAERRGEAADVLVESADRLPGSSPIEARALELLESLNDPAAHERFLVRRLEAAPDRSDLRFRLVRVRYALGEDAAAGQDFETVMAGLEPDEAATRIRELQRYLRGIDRLGAASHFLERYVRDHPAQLEVVRELAEIRASRGERAAVDRLVGGVDPLEASRENVLDLAEFLVEEEFFASARHLLEARSRKGDAPFDLGLLLVRVLGEVGDERAANELIASLRKEAGTPERYARWLEAAATARGRLETADEFFERERNRFSFSEGKWPEERVEKFILLCKSARRRFSTDRVARAIREQLAREGVDAQLRVRLRRLLVSVLEDEPEASGEVLEQLERLAEEDPDNAAEYTLRRAVAHHRNQRVDLARELLAQVDPAEVTAAPLLREAADILVEYGFLGEAERALAVINEREPADVYSWQRRLAVLVATGEEAEFRSVLRHLRSGEAGVEWGEASREALGEHLRQSYWRSISRHLAGKGTGPEEVLPLLATVDREIRSPRARAWSEWTRAHVLHRLRRQEEGEAAAERFRKLVEQHGLEWVTFPDGLSLSGAAVPLAGAEEAGPTDSESNGEVGGFLLGEPALEWAFEVDSGAEIVDFRRSGGRILVRDDRGTFYGLDPAAGKLLWRERFGGGGGAGRRPSFFLDLPAGEAVESDSSESLAAAKRARPFATTDRALFLVRDGAVRAFGSAEGELLCSAALDRASGGGETRPPSAGAAPEPMLAVDAGRVFAFDPESQSLLAVDAKTGKRLWQSRLGSSDAMKRASGSFSLNVGLDAADGLVFAYGRDAAILDARSGEPVWRLGAGEGSTFPVMLRKDRGGDEGAAVETVSKAEPEAEATVKAAWQRGHRAEVEPGRRFLPFPGPGQPNVEALGGSLRAEASLVGPAIQWAEARLVRGLPSLAAMSDDHLWLMQEGSVRRVSTRAPVASEEHPASGTFLGATGNHAWFLEGEFLRHVDFHRDRASRLRVGDIGGDASLRASLVGNRLIVSGSEGVQLVNALTGTVIGRGTWPADLHEYLRRRAPELEQSGEPEAAWQGRIRRRGPGQPARCRPVGSLVTAERFVTAFGRRVLVCVGPRERGAEAGGETSD